MYDLISILSNQTILLPLIIFVTGMMSFYIFNYFLYRKLLRIMQENMLIPIIFVALIIISFLSDIVMSRTADFLCTKAFLYIASFGFLLIDLSMFSSLCPSGDLIIKIESPTSIYKQAEKR